MSTLNKRLLAIVLTFFTACFAVGCATNAPQDGSSAADNALSELPSEDSSSKMQESFSSDGKAEQNTPPELGGTELPLLPL